MNLLAYKLVFFNFKNHTFPVTSTQIIFSKRNENVLELLSAFASLADYLIQQQPLQWQHQTK